jgi:hypothetical protein
LEDNEKGFHVEKNGAVVFGACRMGDDLLRGLRHDHYEIREPELESPRSNAAENLQRHVFDFRCFLRPEMHETQGIGGFCLVDVPFSIIADTVILPLTIYEQIKYGSYAASKPREGKEPTEKTSVEETTGAELITKESVSSQSDREFTAKTR